MNNALYVIQLQCPSCSTDDALDVGRNDQGAALLKCSAGCSPGSVVAAIASNLRVSRHIETEAEMKQLEAMADESMREANNG